MTEFGTPAPPGESGSENAASTLAHRFHAGGFEGPLDLLLHLVRVNEVDITDIPIAEIARQYQEYLEMMREVNLEVAGEYLVMAATLVHIKSRMLLPPEPGTGEEEDETEDPRSELAQQLLDYQRYKQAAETLQAVDSVRSLVWTRDGTVPEEFAGEQLLEVEIFDLLTAFRKVLGRLGEEARLRLRRDNVSVAEKIQWLHDVLEQRGSAGFVELMEELPTVLDRIGAFLAILEMVRLQMLVAFQRKPFDEIRLALRMERSEEDGETLPATGEPAAEDPGDSSSTAVPHTRALETEET